MEILNILVVVGIVILFVVAKKKLNARKQSRQMTQGTRDNMEEKTEDKAEDNTEEKIKCPQCGSSQIHINKKGYGAGKGCCGFLACGPLGFLFGQSGANNLQKNCLKCGRKW